MGKRAHTTEEIIRKLREAEVLLAKGMTIPQAARELGVMDHTYYRWRKDYGVLRLDQAKRLRTLEDENARLKRIVAQQVMEIDALKQVLSKKW